jgi:hypothetical protein
MKRTNVSESLHFQSKVTKYKVRWLGWTRMQEIQSPIQSEKMAGKMLGQQK